MRRGAPTLSVSEQTRVWRDALGRARGFGDAGRVLAKDDHILFSGQIVRLGKTAFPLSYVSATAAATGFLHLARGFITAVRPELVAELGRAMAAAAACCEAFIDTDAGTLIEPGLRSLPPGDR